MFYHVRITQKSDKTRDEVKLDLSKERLISQFINPYEQNKPIIINGKTISPDDLERIKISQTDAHSTKILPVIKDEKRKSGVIMFGGPSDEWYVAEKGEDITDELIKVPIGYKKIMENNVSENKNRSNKIFIVHGHDENLKNQLEIFISENGLEPIVLHRKADEGLTVIEKFEKHSEVGYAFILLTPDDIGYSIEDVSKKEMRARQNVIWEFGYFVGKLGRNKVCCLYKEGVTLPTDVSGMLYKKIKKNVEEVGYAIFKELKIAGYDL